MREYFKVADKILKMTCSMLVSAEASEWESVKSQQHERQLLLKSLDLSNGLEGQYGRDVAKILKEIIRLNAKLIALSEQAKADLEKTIGSVQRGRKANLAYRVLG